MRPGWLGGMVVFRPSHGRRPPVAVRGSLGLEVGASCGGSLAAGGFRCWCAAAESVVAGVLPQREDAGFPVTPPTRADRCDRPAVVVGSVQDRRYRGRLG